MNRESVGWNRFLEVESQLNAVILELDQTPNDSTNYKKLESRKNELILQTIELNPNLTEDEKSRARSGLFKEEPV